MVVCASIFQGKGWGCWVFLSNTRTELYSSSKKRRQGRGALLTDLPHQGQRQQEVTVSHRTDKHRSSDDSSGVTGEGGTYGQSPMADSLPGVSEHRLGERGLTAQPSSAQPKAGTAYWGYRACSSLPFSRSQPRQWSSLPQCQKAPERLEHSQRSNAKDGKLGWLLLSMPHTLLPGEEKQRREPVNRVGFCPGASPGTAVSVCVRHQHCGSDSSQLTDAGERF